MSGVDGAALATTLGWAALAVAAVLAATFVASQVAHKHSVIDVAWGVMFAAIAVAAFAGSAGDGDPVRRWLLLVLPVVWGLRLATHIGRRTAGRPEDPRYVALLAKARGNRQWYALRVVYLLQGVLAYLVAAPVMVGAFERSPAGPVAWIGVAACAAGIAVEAISDRQLARFRRDPRRAGTIMDTGLWRYSRHPNYFGDACVWWGIYLVAASGWPGVLTIGAPILMTLLLTRGSGVRILDRHMSGRPGWAEYAARTSAFVPLPPRSRTTQDR